MAKSSMGFLLVLWSVGMPLQALAEDTRPPKGNTRMGFGLAGALDS